METMTFKFFIPRRCLETIELGAVAAQHYYIKELQGASSDNIVT